MGFILDLPLGVFEGPCFIFCLGGPLPPLEGLLLEEAGGPDLSCLDSESLPREVPPASARGLLAGGGGVPTGERDRSRSDLS